MFPIISSNQPSTNWLGDRQYLWLAHFLPNQVKPEKCLLSIFLLFLLNYFGQPKPKNYTFMLPGFLCCHWSQNIKYVQAFSLQNKPKDDKLFVFLTTLKVLGVLLVCLPTGPISFIMCIALKTSIHIKTC